MSWLARIAGGAIGGGGGWLALSIASWEPDAPIKYGLCGALAAAGFAFGPRIWEAIASIA